MENAIEAVLQTGVVETRYVRAGVGAPVLLLYPDGLADPLAAALFAGLAERFRVVAPALDPGARAPLSRWLRELIDGLGIVQPTIVVDEVLAGALLGFSLVDPGRVGGVVAICRDDADPASSVGMPITRHGLLVVAVDTALDVAESAATAIADIVHFVDHGC